MKPKTLMIISKVSFLSLILYACTISGWRSNLLDIAMFIATFFFTYLGTKNSQYYKVDAASNALFAFAALLVLFGLRYDNPLLGFDKVLHFTAGFILAWSAHITFEKHVQGINKKIVFINLVSYAVAIGAFWEIIEFVFDKLPAPYQVISLGYTDTMLDLVADTLGAAVYASIALFLVAYFIKQTKESNKISNKNHKKILRKY